MSVAVRGTFWLLSQPTEIAVSGRVIVVRALQNLSLSVTVVDAVRVPSQTDDIVAI